MASPNAQIRRVMRMVRNSRYDVPHFANDIAIVFWVQPLIYGSTVQAIRLPTQDFPVPYGENATVSGFGMISASGDFAPNLKSVRVPLVSPENCERAYPKMITDDMVCASGNANYTGTCQGDSGGPLVLNGVIVGVVSWAGGCGLLDKPSVYARVPYFIEWIQDHME